VELFERPAGHTGEQKLMFAMLEDAAAVSRQ
jgi:hypothetical protein